MSIDTLHNYRNGTDDLIYLRCIHLDSLLYEKQRDMNRSLKNFLCKRFPCKSRKCRYVAILDNLDTIKEHLENIKPFQISSGNILEIIKELKIEKSYHEISMKRR